MVAVKRLRLEGLSETEVDQLMEEVELVKRLSHPSIVKYEGMARDPDTLSIVLECVVLRHGCVVAYALLQVRRKWVLGTDTKGIRKAQ